MYRRCVSVRQTRSPWTSRPPRIRPCQTWDAVASPFVDKHGRDWPAGGLPPAATSCCTGDAPSPSTASFNPRRTSNPASHSRPHCSSKRSFILHNSRLSLLSSDSIAYCYYRVIASTSKSIEFFVAAGAQTSTSVPYSTPDPKPRPQNLPPSNHHLGQAHFTIFTNDYLGICNSSLPLFEGPFTHTHHLRQRNLSLSCLYALLRLAPFTITAET